MTTDTSRPALTVNLAAIGRNLDHLRQQAGGADIAPVVKANAYGLGDHRVAEHLVTHHGVRTLFVATVEEAVGIALLLPHAPPLYVLNGYTASQQGVFGRHDIRPVLNSTAQATAWTKDGGGPCAIALDVGMNRLGLGIEETLCLLNQGILGKDDVNLVVMHLSHASAPAASENKAQVEKFDTIEQALRPLLPNARFSLSASGGMMMPHDAKETLVRPGIALWGGAPDGVPGHGLETVATLTAPVVMTRQVTAGETVSYNGRWQAERPSTIAVLSIGYADGYHRALSNKGEVFLGGTRCPIVGAVTMDLTMVDVTDAPKPVAEGDHAEIFGPHINIDCLADEAGTIAYELLTSVGQRVKRVYEVE